MKLPISIAVVILFVCYSFSKVQDAPVTRDQFVGKWAIVDDKINGVTDPDCLFESDSSTYWFHADGNFTMTPHWYAMASDSAYIDGTWEYNAKKNSLILDWKKSDSNPKGTKQKWRVKQIDATTLVIGAVAEIQLQKIP